MNESIKLFERARAVIPGGVNSPVRSFSAVSGTPPFIRSGSGARIMDEDGRTYIDYVGSWGPLILGHAHPAVLEAVSRAIENGLGFGAAARGEVELAERIVSMVPSVESVRLTCSGTEAVMSAIRLARAYTGREKIIKFEGCYHGHSDAMLAQAGATIRDSGVTAGIAADTIPARFNDTESVRAAFDAHAGEVAALITELVPANMGVVPPDGGFLKSLQELCRANGALFIADEVITGFRIGPGGAQERFGLSPDLSTFGKIIGGGLPVGAFGGRREIMKRIAPLGTVYQAGTLAGNPVAAAAGNAQLRYLAEHPEVYAAIERRAEAIEAGLNRLITKRKVRARINRAGSMFTVFFPDTAVRDFPAARASDTAMFAAWHAGMLARGVYLAPSQFEAAFVSDAHTEADVTETLDAAAKTLEEFENVGEVEHV